MSEKEKEGYYFKIIPNEQWKDFINNFKDALLKSEKKKENKSCEFEITTTKEDLKEACVFEIFTFDKARYFDYFDEQKDYFKNSTFSISLNLEAKEEKIVNEVEKYFKSFFAKDTKQFEIFSRNKGKQVSIDFISKKSSPILEDLLDLGINLTEYHKFNLIIKLGLNLIELFGQIEDINTILEKIYSLIFTIKSQTNNIKYIINALIEALKNIKFDNEKKKTIDKVLGYLNLINSFIRTNIKLEFNNKYFVKNYNSSSKIGIPLEHLDIYFSTIIYVFAFDLKDGLVLLNVDKISLYIRFP